LHLLHLLNGVASSVACTARAKAVTLLARPLLRETAAI
jgi:hypothetical protein